MGLWTPQGQGGRCWTVAQGSISYDPCKFSWSLRSNLVLVTKVTRFSLILFDLLALGREGLSGVH